MRRAKIMAVQAVIAFVLLELGLRLYSPIPFRIRGDRIVLPVNQVYRFDNRAASKLDPVTLHTKNSLGLRGPEPPRDFDRRLTILTIGGSTTESLFLSDGQTWTDAMARGLASAPSGVWVNNAGLDGQSTYGHVALLRQFVIGLHPKVAVFLVGTNDVGIDRSNTYDAALTPSGSLLRRAALAVVNHSDVLMLGQNLLRARRARDRGFGHSQVDIARLNDLALDDAVMNATVRRTRDLLDGYAERLKEITALCRNNRIEPVFLTQPALFGPVVDPATGIDLTRKQVNGRGNGELEWRLLELYNDVTRRVARDEGVFLIDVAHQLPKDSRLFYDFLHYTNEGSAELGRLVADALAPHLIRGR